MPSFSAYDGAAWRTAITGTAAYDGTAWRTAVGIWVSDGATWRKGFTNLSLSSVTVKDTVCNPTNGQFRVYWTYTGDVGSYTITIEYRLGTGSSNPWNTYISGVAPTTSPYDGDLSGYAGWSTLNDTDFRIHLTDGTEANNSPIIVYPPYACV